MSKKFIFSIITIIILGGGILAGTYLVSQNQDIREKAAPATSLSLEPSTQGKNPGQTFNLIVNADTGENKITGVDVDLTFNPEVMQITQMVAMPAISNLSSIIKNGEIDNTAGRARFATYTANKDQAVSGNLNMISVTGTILTNAVGGSYQISFSDVTTLAAADEGVNVVINKSPATVVVSGGVVDDPTPTPTDGGIGGGDIKLPTSTPTPTTRATATTRPTVAPTVPSDLPVTGVSFPLIGSLGLGVAALVFSLFLAF